MKTNDQRDEQPFTVKQLAEAMAALGMYGGENTDVEHADEAAHLGGLIAYQIRLANALLGVVEANALLAESSGVSTKHLEAAHQQALNSAGVEDDAGKLLNFFRWRTLRVGEPLRKIAQKREVGPLPFAAAHAAEGPQLLLGVCAAGQNLGTASPKDLIKDLKATREALTNALANLDSMLKLLSRAEDLLR